MNIIINRKEKPLNPILTTLLQLDYLICETPRNMP
jgi:hypothetical protein